MSQKEFDLNARRKRKITFDKQQTKYRSTGVQENDTPSQPEKPPRMQGPFMFDIESGDKQIFDEFREELSSAGKEASRLERNREEKYEQTVLDHFRNGLWVISACLLYSFLDIPKVIMHDYRVKQNVFVAALFCTAIFLAISAYHVVWLSWVKGLTDNDWAKVFPLGVPVATTAIVCSFFLYVIAFWSIWSVFTPIILYALTMPIIVLISYI